MKRILEHIEVHYYGRLILGFFLLIISLCVQAQEGPRYFGLAYQQINPNAQTLTLSESYGFTLLEYLEGSEFLENTPWRILDQKARKLLEQGLGESLVDFSFDQPGNFVIELDVAATHNAHDNTCFHPDIPDVIALTILPSKLSYDLESVKISGPLRGGVDLSGVMLSIRITVESLEDSLISIPKTILGVGVENHLKGYLSEAFYQVEKGDYFIQYTLEGTVKSGTFIGIQFEDLAGKHSVYLLPEAIDSIE